MRIGQKYNNHLFLMINIKKELRDRHLVAIIADADMVTGMLLAGIGTSDGSVHNYFIVDSKTLVSDIEKEFTRLTGRRDVAILMITQPVADRIRHLVDDYSEMLPALLEIPSKDSPYDIEKDSLLRRIDRLCSRE
jgi:V-type H+-transporting ATPase subunit F